MTIYVDPCRWPRGGRLMCNVWADSVGELQVAAKAVGLPPSALFQPPHSSWCHYEADADQRAVLIARGAVQTDIYGPSEFNARRAGDHTHLRAIAQLRAQHTPSIVDIEGADHG